MSDRACKLVELDGSSPSCADHANRQSIETEAKALRHIQWFEVTETRGHVVEGKCAHIRVASRSGCRFQD